jgi:leader peptidase (prepilin peptidase)/N-methyltransferase
VGSCIGSFLNVCVYRIPLNRSVVSPGSHCSACGAPIPWYNNLPIISWIVLRGRAACCGTRIDARYCIVEAGMAFLFLAIWLKFGETDPIAAVIYAIMTSGLAAACLIDLDHYIIPDRFSLGGCVAGFIVKLLAALCAFLGTTSISWILPLSSLIGSVLGIALIFWQRGAWGTRIPYGPFLGLAAVLWLFGGSDLTHTYWHHVWASWNSTTGPMVPESLANPGR